MRPKKNRKPKLRRRHGASSVRDRCGRFLLPKRYHYSLARRLIPFQALRFLPDEPCPTVLVKSIDSTRSSLVSVLLHCYLSSPQPIYVRPSEHYQSPGFHALKRRRAPLLITTKFIFTRKWNPAVARRFPALTSFVNYSFSWRGLRFTSAAYICRSLHCAAFCRWSGPIKLLDGLLCIRGACLCSHDFSNIGAFSASACPILPATGMKNFDDERQMGLCSIVSLGFYDHHDARVTTMIPFYAIDNSFWRLRQATVLLSVRLCSPDKIN